MGFEEAVEERYVVKAETERNLFDLEIGDFQLRLGVGDDGFDDDISRCPFADGFDGGAQVRQGQTQSVCILAHMVPLLIMLEHQLAVFLIDFRLAVQRFDEVLVLLACKLGITGL